MNSRKSEIDNDVSTIILEIKEKERDRMEQKHVKTTITIHDDE